MNLPELNDQWRAAGKAHAVGEGNTYQWHCPKCGKGGRTAMALIGAMSDAVTHKYHCEPVS